MLQNFPCYDWLDRWLSPLVIDVCSLRVSVGAFRAVQCSSVTHRKGEHVFHTRIRPMELSITIWLLALLLLAGDVEENPGPPKITREQATLLSQRVFREFYSRVSAAIQGCLDRFAGELLSENVVGWEVMKEVTETTGLTSTKKATIVLLAVQSKIASTKGDKPFRSLCRVMKNYPLLKDLAKEMMERFEYLSLNGSSESDGSSDEESHATAQRLDSSRLTTCPTTTKAPPTQSGLPARGGHLTIEQLVDVKQELGYFSSWNDLGLNLGLHPDLLEVIGCKQRVNERVHDVLYEWLSMNYAVERYGPPTWGRLADAVDRINHALAITIRQRHPHSSRT